MPTTRRAESHRKGKHPAGKENSAPGSAENHSPGEFRQCPVCEYPQAVPHFRLGDRFFAATSEVFLLYRCRYCGLVFQDEQKIKGRLDTFYPMGYWWYRSGRVSTLEQAYREWVVKMDQLAFLKRAMSGSAPASLLDIGCGGGTFVKLATLAGYDAYGLEQSPEALSIARKVIPGRVFSGGLQQFEDAGRRFEVISLFHCLEHLTEPFPYLKRVRKLLTRPGSLIVQVPNVDSLQARILGRRWYGLDCPRHVNNFTADSLLHLLGRCGYRVQYVRHFSLRDNAAALISSLLPGLDPMSQRVKLLRGIKKVRSSGYVVKELTYFHLVMLAQPLAWLESLLGRGGTVTVHVTVEDWK